MMCASSEVCAENGFIWKLARCFAWIGGVWEEILIPICLAS